MFSAVVVVLLFICSRIKKGEGQRRLCGYIFFSSSSLFLFRFPWHIQGESAVLPVVVSYSRLLISNVLYSILILLDSAFKNY